MGAGWGFKGVIAQSLKMMLHSSGRPKTKIKAEINDLNWPNKN